MNKFIVKEYRIVDRTSLILECYVAFTNVAEKCTVCFVKAITVYGYC